MDLAAGRGRTGVGLSFPVIYLQWGPGRCKEMSVTAGGCGRGEGVPAVAVTIPDLCPALFLQLILQAAPVTCAERLRQILFKQLWDGSYQSSVLFLELSEYSSWVPGAESSHVWQSHTARPSCSGIQREMRILSLHLLPLLPLPLFPCAEVSQSWNWAAPLQNTI